MASKFIELTVPTGRFIEVKKHANEFVKVRVSRALKFKWQWALFYEEKTYYDGKWMQRVIICDSRAEARLFKAHKTVEFGGRPDRNVRNVRIKRRLVQANWDEYNDSFTYNAKGNGNGR